MQIGPANPVLQTLAGTQETGNVRQQSATIRVDTARAVGAPNRSDAKMDNQLHTKRDPDDDDNTKPKPRGSLIDLVI